MRFTTRTIVLLAATVVLIGVVLYFMLATGDEPPIRVRNGSMHFTAVDAEWLKGDDPSDPSWFVSAGKPKGPYKVLLLADPAQPKQGCTKGNVMPGAAHTVEFTTDNGTTYTLKAIQRGNSLRSRLPQSSDYTLVGLDTLTSSSADRYVSKITTRNAAGVELHFCEFAKGAGDIACVASTGGTPDCTP